MQTNLYSQFALNMHTWGSQLRAWLWTHVIFHFQTVTISDDSAKSGAGVAGGSRRIDFGCASQSKKWFQQTTAIWKKKSTGRKSVWNYIFSVRSLMLGMVKISSREDECRDKKCKFFFVEKCNILTQWRYFLEKKSTRTKTVKQLIFFGKKLNFWTW